MSSSVRGTGNLSIETAGKFDFPVAQVFTRRPHAASVAGLTLTAWNISLLLELVHSTTEPPAHRSGGHQIRQEAGASQMGEQGRHAVDLRNRRHRAGRLM